MLKINYVLSVSKINVYINAAFTLKLSPPQHDYSDICRTFNILSMPSRQNYADSPFMHALLNNLLDAPDFLSRVLFKVPSHNTRIQTPFYTLTHSIFYDHNHPLYKMLRSVVNN